MKQMTDYSDTRNRGACIHCGVHLNSRNRNKDHVPSKCLLVNPLPANLPKVAVCKECNGSFSMDEEYFSTFLEAVISGHIDPDSNESPSEPASVKGSAGLRKRISRARTEQSLLFGGSEVSWQPEIDRIHSVIVKNARGHVFYELGEPLAYPPSIVECLPVIRMPVDRRDAFEQISLGSGWPEVGSRMMQRVAGIEPLVDGWILVQDGVYRYAVFHVDDKVIVRTMIRDYLATQVTWEY
ncbi:MAG: hypothetical protein F4Z02_10625 [Acidimicrobiia bacterium]|nr:hypothetical protein [Acidimicrobiia bacterium]MYG71566.1 hypothetical protein [Acidimicrobiia bacterium]